MSDDILRWLMANRATLQFDDDSIIGRPTAEIRLRRGEKKYSVKKVLEEAAVELYLRMMTAEMDFELSIVRPSLPASTEKDSIKTDSRGQVSGWPFQATTRD